MVNYPFLFIILVLGFILGLFVAHLSKDELKNGRKWFLVLALSFFIFSLIFYYYEKIPAFYSSIFVVFFCLGSIFYTKYFIKSMMCHHSLKAVV